MNQGSWTNFARFDPRRPLPFSLVEVLLAFALLGIVLAGMSQVFEVGRTLSAHSRARTRAALLGEQCIEETYQLGGETLARLSEQPPKEETRGIFTVVRSIAPHPDGPSGLYSVRVHVRWKGNKRTRELEFESMTCDRGSD